MSIVSRLMAIAAAHTEDPVVAYLCAWTAVERVVGVLAWRAGVRPQFSLRKNGTLRTRKEQGYKLPDLLPAREDHLWRAALKTLSAADQRSLLSHPNVRALAARVPMLNGKPVYKDAYGQQPHGVLDVTMTRDPRYPVWHTVDFEGLTEVLGDPDCDDDADELVWQVSVVLRTIHGNLLAEGEDTDAALAQLGYPLVVSLVAGLASAEDGETIT